MKVSILPLGSMHANCLIVTDEATGFSAVIDPGGESEDCIDRILTRAASDGREIKYILLTHAHFDHMLSLSRLRERTGAPLGVHEHDAESLLDPHLTYMAQFAGIHTPEAAPEFTFSDGDTIQLGETVLEIIHTPGHTMGSVCYKAGNIIITGDTLFAGSIGRCDLFGGDEMAMDHSLRRLCELPDDCVLYPGHGPKTTLRRERDTNIYLKHF